MQNKGQKETKTTLVITKFGETKLLNTVEKEHGNLNMTNPEPGISKYGKHEAFRKHKAFQKSFIYFLTHTSCELNLK